MRIVVTNISLELALLIKKLLKDSQSHGIQLHLDSPKLSLKWSGAVGFTARANNFQRAPISIEHPIRIASNTKSFVAVAILRLWEQQLIGLDDSIERYLSSLHADMIQEAGYSLAELTTRHLLSHTAGLYDYGDSEDFVHAIIKNPKYHWTRTQQLKMALASGKSYGQPGEVFRYGDTSYILLGEIIEQISGQNLATALRKLLDYQRLGLNRTWLESAEDIPHGVLPLVHQYKGGLDTHDLDASCDIYGGGGLVSTVGDMTRFMRALFSGQVYCQQNTLITMLSTVAATKSGDDYAGWVQVPGTYRLGLDGGKDSRVYQHRGHFGTLAAYVPELDLSLAFSLNVAHQGHGPDPCQALLADILLLLGFKR